MIKEASKTDNNSPSPDIDGKAIFSTNDPSKTAGQSQKDRKGMRPQQYRRLITRFSAILFIVLPTLLSVVYFGAVASDQYAVEMRFAVRGVNADSGTDLMGMVTGIPSSGSTTSDSYILMDYIHSRPILEKLRQNFDLNRIFGPEKADFLSSFKMDRPIEELVEYWKNMTTISYDSSSQIIVVEVRAFTPQDAKQIAETVFRLSEEMVNKLSAKARDDAVSYARNEVMRMEKRLRTSRQAVRAFREKEQMIDPSKTAESRLLLLAKLESELSTEKAKRRSLGQFMKSDSPRMKVFASKIEALERQVQNERQKPGDTKGKEIMSTGPLTGLLENYRNLLMDQEFSEKAYIMTLSSLEKAQLEAGRRQRYLAVFVESSLPEEALYPKRLLNIFLTLIISVILWTIGTLVIYAVRDHAT